MKSKLFVFLVVLICVVSCSKNPIIIPEFNTATEQFLFAKNLKDKGIYEQPKGKDRKIHDRAVTQAYQNVIDRFPDDKKVTPLAWIELGDIYFKLKDYDKTLFYYETAKHQYPNQDDIQCRALFGTARTHDRLKNFEEAISLYRQCFMRFENDSRPYLAIIGQQARINYSRIRVQ